MILESVMAAILGVLIGSIPFGLILTRAAGLGDIRAIGSGSIGATNVLRTGNKALAVATLLLDFTKGAGAVWAAHALVGPGPDIVAGAAAVLGHCFPPWLGFRGGKGVATAAGVLLALAWPVLLIAGAVWLAVALIWRISSLGALAALGAASLASVVLAPGPVGMGILVIASFVAWRHQSNIRRLIAGTEPRIGEGK